MLRLIMVALFSALYLILVGPPMILHARLTGSADRLYWEALWGTKMALRLAGVCVRVEGLENIPPGVCIFVSNHTSTADPPAVVNAIPRRISLLAKKELFRVPIFGTAMRVGQL